MVAGRDLYHTALATTHPNPERQVWDVQVDDISVLKERSARKGV